MEIRRIECDRVRGLGFWPFVLVFATTVAAQYLVYEWRRAPVAKDPLCIPPERPITCKPVSDDKAQLRLRSFERAVDSVAGRLRE